MKAFAVFCFVCSLAGVFGFPSGGPRPLVSWFPEGVPVSAYDFLLPPEVVVGDAESHAQLVPPALYLSRPDSEAVADADSLALTRHKRQTSRDLALGLASSHQDRFGNDRPVGSIHGRVDAAGSGRDARNWGATVGAGVGSVLWRSDNGRHSLGAGGYVSQDRGRFNGYGFSSKPNFGVGLGYRFRF